MSKDFIKDKCGVFGIWGAKNASEYAYLGLHLLQHRGQEHCGIVTGSDSGFHEKHGEGIVNEVFSKEDLQNLKGSSAIGHVKYTTQGSSSIKNAQPFKIDINGKPFAIAHNGEFANQESVRKKLEEEGSIFTTTSDTELVLHKFAKSKAEKIEKKIYDTFVDLSPAYSIVMLTDNELIGVRDPSGVRPLEMGSLPNGIVVLSSETSALDAIGARHIGEVAPGEMVRISSGNIKITRTQLFPPEESLPCIFEHIYFGRPDSFQFGCGASNSAIRKEFGRQLCREHPAKANVVISVPDSSNDAALGYSEESGIPFDFGLIRSHYIGRTFIQPTQTMRDAGVAKKFSVNRSAVNRRNLVVVDDSIIRATTLKKLVRLLKEFGAREIHVRVASPPYKHSCYLGIHTPKEKELIAHNEGSIEGVKDFIGADSLGYLSQEGLLSNPYLRSKGYCTHCFDGVEKIKKC